MHAHLMLGIRASSSEIVGCIINLFLQCLSTISHSIGSLLQRVLQTEMRYLSTSDQSLLPPSETSSIVLVALSATIPQLFNFSLL